MDEEVNNENCDDGASALENNSVDIPGYGPFSAYIKEGYKVMMQGVKSSSSLPSGRNYQFYHTYSNFRDKMREKVSDIHDLMEDLLSSQGVKRAVRDVMLEDALDTMITMNDKMLDRATRCMDVMEGVKTGLGELAQEISGSWNKPKKKDKLNSFSLTIKKNIPRPQFTFKDKIDNSNTIWEPKIKEKPNAIKPLAVLLERTDDGDECFSHPYEYELEVFSPPDSQLSRKQILSEPLPLDQTPLVHVDTEQKLDELISYLEVQEAIAVDLEHHNYRSFMGFTCLIQISSREKDFLIDSLQLRHCLHKLNQVFTKPSLLKVLHGADSDVIWLQRDFGVYIVNMFDTHQAAKLLNFPKLSLAYLLNKYCSIDPNKHFQLFDWRTRPLPDEAVKYAREDTHYLLHIADILTNELLDKANGNTNILRAAYGQSSQVCKKRFEKLVVDEESHMSVYRKGKRFFDNRQLFALKALYLWRDKTARELDESLAYVLPDNMMLNIAETLPREVQGILACCNPVPPLVKANLVEIHYLIVRAKEQPLVKVVQETARSQMTTTKTMGASAEQHLLEQWLYPPAESRDNLPTLLTSADDLSDADLDQAVDAPRLSIFDKDEDNWYSTSNDTQVQLDSEVMNRLKGLNFVSPYQRYVKVLPYSAQLEKERKENEMREADEYRTRSREQQSLAMKIQTLQESGLIKLKREDEEKETLKIQLIEERKRRNAERAGTTGTPPTKQARNLYRRDNRQNRKDHDATATTENSNHRSTPPNSHELHQAELRGAVKSECEGDSQAESHNSVETPGNKSVTLKCEKSEDEVPPAPGLRADAKPTSWKQFRQQGGGFKPFDYSQVDYRQKFGGSEDSKTELKGMSGNVNKIGQKRRWKNNPGAQTFTKKKRKRNSVV